MARTLAAAVVVVVALVALGLMPAPVLASEVEPALATQSQVRQLHTQPEETPEQVEQEQPTQETAAAAVAVTLAVLAALAVQVLSLFE